MGENYSNLIHVNPHATTSAYDWLEGRFEHRIVQEGKDDFYEVWGDIKDC